MRKLYARSRAIVRIVRNVFHSTMFVVPPFRYIYELGNCHHWLPFVYIFGMPVVYIYIPLGCFSLDVVLEQYSTTVCTSSLILRPTCRGFDPTAFRYCTTSFLSTLSSAYLCNYLLLEITEPVLHRGGCNYIDCGSWIRRLVSTIINSKLR